MTSASSAKALQGIPGVGPKLADSLLRLGYRQVEDLKGEDPESMYERFMELEGKHVDRCVLYVYRCAVYFASNEAHDADKLQWWNWKE